MLRTFIALSALVAAPSIALAQFDTSGLGTNPNAKSQGSCVGVFSSQVTHNGTVVREQAQSEQGRAFFVEQARDADCQRADRPN